MDEETGVNVSAQPEGGLSDDGESSLPAQGTQGEEESSAEERGPLSLEDAFTQAKAALAEDTAGDAEGNGENTVPDSEPGAADSKDEEEQPPEQPRTVQQEIDRALQLLKLGREAELDPQVRGLVNRLRADERERIAQEAEQEEQFRELYLGLLAQEAEDPVEFIKTLESERGQQLLRFKMAYAQAHPEVTLDSPQTPVVKREDVRQRAFVEAFDIVDAGLATVTQKYGLSEANLDEAYQSSNGDFAAYLDNVVAAAVKAEVERERPKIAKAEREAHALELQAARANKTIITPAPLNGRPASKEARRIPHQAGSFSDAFAAAASRARETAEA